MGESPLATRQLTRMMVDTRSQTAVPMRWRTTERSGPPLLQGGLEAVQAANEAKAAVVYGAIAASAGFYASPVAPEARSRMNIPFTMPARPELEKGFVAEAAKAGMVRHGPAFPRVKSRLLLHLVWLCTWACRCN